VLSLLAGIIVVEDVLNVIGADHPHFQDGFHDHPQPHGPIPACCASARSGAAITAATPATNVRRCITRSPDQPAAPPREDRSPPAPKLVLLMSGTGHTNSGFLTVVHEPTDQEVAESQVPSMGRYSGSLVTGIT
jgi:hypothetical protein